MSHFPAYAVGDDDIVVEIADDEILEIANDDDDACDPDDEEPETLRRW